MTETQRPPTDADVVVVGGGFYGAHIATFLARRGQRVVLLERETALLTRASYHNQARVHGGYHYPRSILTSLRSRRNYPRFLAEYPAAIDASFTKLYAIARRQSKVTASQFVEFCRRIGAPIAPAAKGLAARFDRDLVDAVFEVEETAFDAVRLAEASARGLEEAGVTVCRGIGARAVAPAAARRLQVQWGAGESSGTGAGAGVTGVIQADWVFACTYSALNDLLADSGLPTVPLVHELTEMALVEVPAAMRGLGVTVMDGPFWSCMPFPPSGVHSLSHVRYTPHARWTDGAPGEPRVNGRAVLATPRPSHTPHMLRDAARYLPELAASQYLRSLWEVKTILPRSEVDDSRPILARGVEGAPGLVTVLGAKIDSVYDVEDAVRELLVAGRAP